ncbi:MAG: hypothetical protein K2P57_02615 [Burkholderiales bacterium]|nr:hypothetical protein [Burkholderiales bacterium]
MPMLIEHIDAIARKKQRDVLCVAFEPDNPSGSPEDDDYDPFQWVFIDWENLPVRQQIIDWLDGNGIEWQPCAHIANPNTMLPYRGWIYIDVPYDTSLPEYRKLADFLENPDGSMRLQHAVFCFVPLEKAMENAHHDEPGFWEKWAENF